MGKHILMVTAEFPPCGGGGVGRCFAIVQHLAKAGHQVTVICASENSYTYFDNSYPQLPANVRRIQVWSPELRHWIRRIKSRFPMVNPADRFIVWRYLAIRKVLSLHRKHPFDLVISSYPIFSNHAVAYSLVKRTGLPWIADYRDPPWWMYSEQHHEQPEFYEFAKRTQQHVVTTERARQLLATKLVLDPAAVRVITNGCDLLAAQLPAQQPDSKPIELLHTGSVYEEGRDINLLIKVTSKFAPSVSLRFIGDPPYASTKVLLKELGETSFVQFTSYVPAAEALTAAASSHVLVVIQGPLFENQVPGKVFEYLALQKPILLISNRGSATYELLHDEPNVIFAEYGNASSIAEGITKACQHQVVSVDRMRFTRDHLGERFAALCQNVLERA